MDVEAAGTQDTPQLLALLQAEDLHEDLGEHAATKVFAVTDDGVVAGGIALETYARSGLLRSLVVGPRWRGRDLGRRLVERVVTEATEQNLADLTLLTLTVPVFFEKLGFTRIERSSAPAPVRESYEFTTFCPDTAVVMLRQL